MTIDDTRSTTVRRQVPRPRQPEASESDRRSPERFPWPEPWGSSRAAHPRTEYWDVATASWRSRGPVSPRSGD